MSDNYQNIKGTLRPSFKISPNGVEIISKVVPNSNLKELYIKRNQGDATDHKVLTEYDMEIPTRAIATYTEVSTQDGDFVVFSLHNGETLRIPKTISNLEQAGTVIGPDSAKAGNIALFADNTGINIDDQGHGIIDNMNDSKHINYAESPDVPTAKAVWNLVGESKLLLYARLQGLIDTTGYVPDSGDNTPESPTYRLELRINCLNSVPSTFRNIQLIHRYPDFSEEYTNNNIISEEARRTYSYSMNNLISDNDFGFKLVIHDIDLGDIYIGGEDGADFVISPDGNNIIKADVSFEYPAEGTTVVGDFEQNFGGETEYILSNNDKTIKERHIFYNNYVAERTITIHSILATERNDGKYKIELENDGIGSTFEYELLLNIDNEDIQYDITGSSVTLSTADSAKYAAAQVVKITPLIWGHSLATFVVKE